MIVSLGEFESDIVSSRLRLLKRLSPSAVIVAVSANCREDPGRMVTIKTQMFFGPPPLFITHMQTERSLALDKTQKLLSWCFIFYYSKRKRQ